MKRARSFKFVAESDSDSESNSYIPDNYENICKLRINNKVYYVHEHILKKCNYFDSYGGNLKDETELTLPIGCIFDFNLIISLLSDSTHFVHIIAKCSFDQIVNIIHIIDFLHPYNIGAIKTFYSSLKFENISIKNILEASLNNTHKKNLIKLCIQNTKDTEIRIDNVNNKFYLNRSTFQVEAFAFSQPTVKAEAELKSDHDTIDSTCIVNLLKSCGVDSKSCVLKYNLKNNNTGGFSFGGNTMYELHIDDKCVYKDRDYIFSINLQNILLNYICDCLIGKSY